MKLLALSITAVSEPNFWHFLIAANIFMDSEFVQVHDHKFQKLQLNLWQQGYHLVKSYVFKLWDVISQHDYKTCCRWITFLKKLVSEILLIIASGITSWGEMSRSSPGNHYDFLRLFLFLFSHRGKCCNSHHMEVQTGKLSMKCK